MGTWSCSSPVRERPPYQPAPGERVPCGRRRRRHPATAPRSTLVSNTPSGGPGNGSSTSPSVSGDGRIVVFQSEQHRPRRVGRRPRDRHRSSRSSTERRARLAARVEATRPTISADGTVVVYDTLDRRPPRSVGSGVPVRDVSEVSLSIGVDGRLRPVHRSRAPWCRATGPSPCSTARRAPHSPPILVRDGHPRVRPHGRRGHATNDAATDDGRPQPRRSRGRPPRHRRPRPRRRCRPRRSPPQRSRSSR